MFDTWRPSPFSLVLPVGLLAVGAWCFGRGMVALGVSLWVLAWVIVAWVIVADVMARRARYLDAMADVLNASAKNDLDKIASLGFTSQDVAGSVSVELTDRRDGIHSTKFFELPISSAKIIPLAHGVLNGQPFSERRWTGAGALLTTNEFRSLRGVLRDRGMLELVSDADHRQGYKLNQAGRELFASLLPSPPPLMEVSENA